jgi:hypothetical protein
MGFCPELAFFLFIFFTCFYALQGAEENESKAENRGLTPVFHFTTAQLDSLPP